MTLLQSSVEDGWFGGLRARSEAIFYSPNVTFVSSEGLSCRPVDRSLLSATSPLLKTIFASFGSDLFNSDLRVITEIPKDSLEVILGFFQSGVLDKVSDISQLDQETKDDFRCLGINLDVLELYPVEKDEVHEVKDFFLEPANVEDVAEDTGLFLDDMLNGGGDLFDDDKLKVEILEDHGHPSRQSKPSRPSKPTSVKRKLPPGISLSTVSAKRRDRKPDYREDGFEDDFGNDNGDESTPYNDLDDPMDDDFVPEELEDGEVPQETKELTSSNRPRLKKLPLHIQDFENCPTCDLLVRKGKPMKRHELTHKFESIDPENKWFCLKCEAGFKTRDDLNRHERSAHDPKLQGIECPCGRSFPPGPEGKDQYERHLMRHICIACGANITKNNVHFKNMGPYHKPTCHQCNDPSIKFQSWTEHVAHIDSYHNGIFLHVCGKCNKLFKSFNELNIHKKHVHPVTEPGKKSICPECGKEVAGIKHHMEDVHGDQPSTCELCGKVCRHPKSLRRHKTDMHKTPSTCQECGKKFNQKHKLNLHMTRVHTSNEEKPWKCLICGKGFARRAYLFRHNANVHKGQGRELHENQRYKEYTDPSFYESEAQ